MKHGAIKAPWKCFPDTWFPEFPAPHQASKECPFLAGTGTLGYLGDLVKRNSPNSTGITGPSDRKSLVWLPAWRGYKASVWRFLRRDSSKVKHAFKDP